MCAIVLTDHFKLDFLLKDLKYTREQVEDSLSNRKYDEILATYMLLSTKPIQQVMNMKSSVWQLIIVFDITLNV